MPASAQTAAPSPGSARPPAAGTAAGIADAAAESRIADQVFTTQRQLSDMTLAFANEVMGFATRRMQAQADFMQQLSRCHDAADLLDTQLRFVADTTKDYATEMTTLAKVMQPQA